MIMGVFACFLISLQSSRPVSYTHLFAVFPNIGAMKLLGTVRSVRGGGFVLCDGNGRSFLLPDDFSVDTAQ